jgi:hypothetical protein
MPHLFIKKTLFYSFYIFLFLVKINNSCNAQVLQNGNSSANKIFGLTIDESSFDEATLHLNDAQQIEHIITELKLIKAANPTSKAFTVRIVLPIGCESGNDCDPTEKILTNKLDAKYVTLLQRIKQENIANIMAEFVDSDIASSGQCFVGLDYAKSVACYLSRIQKMYAQLGKYVDIWEIGNEVNGDWVGGLVNGEAKNVQRRKIVVGQLKVAYDFIEEQKARIIKSNIANKNNEMVPASAITFYFSGIENNRHSYENKNDEMTSWMLGEGEHFLDKNKNKISFSNLDYALVSYYPDDNFYMPAGAKQQIPIVLSATEWVSMFAKIKTNYGANTKFGLGEVGAQCYYAKKINNCTDCKTLLLDYDTNEKNPCDKYDTKGELIESRNCPCCYCAQVKVMADYYTVLHQQICNAMQKDTQFKTDDRFIGGYFNWYYSADVLNKMTVADIQTKAQGDKVRQAIITAFTNFK